MAFSISVTSRPCRHIRTAPVDSLIVIAMLFVAAVMAAAAAWRVPSPCGSSSATSFGSRFVPAESMVPVPFIMNAPSIVENSFTVSVMFLSSILHSLSG